MTKWHKNWNDIDFYQFFHLPLTSHHPIHVEEKLEWSENEKRDITKRAVSENHLEISRDAGTSQQIIGNRFDLWITDRFPLLFWNLKLLAQVEKKLELDSSQEYSCTLF